MDNSVEVRSVEVRSVEVRYAGVVVGRGVVRESAGADAAFVAVPEPLPIGTFLTFKIGDAVREGRVEDIVESADANVVGMRVRWGAAPPAAKPAPAPAPEVGAAPVAPLATSDSGPDGESGPVEAGDEGGDAIPAPLSLAGPGGGKRRRKRR